MRLSKIQRSLLFWTVCLPFRYYFASSLAAQYPTTTRVVAAFVGGRWVTGEQMNVEGFFGGPAWWADARRLHGVLWLGYAAVGARDFLFADVAFGAVNKLLH